MMGVSIKLDYRAIQGVENAIRTSAQEAVEAVMSDLVNSETMPFDTGDMQNNQTFIDADENRVSIVTGSPQARRLYTTLNTISSAARTKTQVRFGLNRISMVTRRISCWTNTQKGLKRNWNETVEAD